MNSFYQLLLNKPVSEKPYLNALIELTNTSREQMHTLASDLAWQLCRHGGAPGKQCQHNGQRRIQ
jgi:hypothetical protein